MLPNKSLPWPIDWRGVELIARAEGCKLTAYLCPADVWTCGWGETAGVTASTRWAQDEADRRFCESLAEFTRRVRALCTVEPTPGQLAALVSLAYNIGVGALRGSTVLRIHNARQFAQAADAFSMWNKAGGKVLPGLVTRRAAEARLYGA